MCTGCMRFVRGGGRERRRNGRKINSDERACLHVYCGNVLRSIRVARCDGAIDLLHKRCTRHARTYSAASTGIADWRPAALGKRPY